MDKLEILKRYFGHDSFRPGQETVVDALLSGNDVLAVMPTGAGKSVCYQVPGMQLEGLTLVISPLISLMKDQVSALNAAGMPAAYINSTLSPGQMEKAIQLAYQGKYRFIYVAPERLAAPSFLRFSQNVPIALIAVDEAHCVSQWGQDFRPSYLRIADYLNQLPKRPPVGAFTATATKRVCADIERLLNLRSPCRVTTGFDRPNLFFEIIQQKKRSDAILKLVQGRKEDSGIIYCNSRKQVEDLTVKLRAAGIQATRYHAGLSDEERRANQEDFQYDRARVMVATNAFGMGIDKSNVRYVLHAQMPMSIEAYYQEAGRAGRDGEPAECLLLYSRQDIMVSRYLMDNTAPNEALTDEERTAVLQQSRRRLNQMINLCEGTGCIRAELLSYFGQQASGRPCGACSRCAGSRVEKYLSQPVSAPRMLPMPLSNPGDDALEDLLVRLKACRMSLARDAHMPVYIICDDKTLRDMAQRLPRTPDDLRQVKGMGEIKIQKYGEEFLKAIEKWLQIHPEVAGTSPESGREPQQKGPQILLSEEERGLLNRCEKARLTTEQMSIILGQPVSVIEEWLNSR